MVTIKRIEIKGFFGKGDFEWNLDPVVNILGGKNGSGKSTLFKLCYALLANKKIESNTDKQFSALFKKVSLTLSNDWTIVWKYKDIILLNQKGEIQDLSQSKELVKVFMINSFEQNYVSLITRMQDQKHLYISNTGAIPLDSLIDNEINLRNKNLSAAVDKYMDESANEITALNEYKKKHNMINTSLSHFMTEYDKKISSDFVFSKKGEKIPWQSLSMGEKQILLLLLMVSNAQQQPCIFFMDEPDLSMHIDWKEILVKELHELNPNMQIILSTHAPSVITGWHDKVKEVNQLIKK